MIGAFDVDGNGRVAVGELVTRDDSAAKADAELRRRVDPSGSASDADLLPERIAPCRIGSM